ncbi:MAG TPA: hypothetical protein V6C95_08330 [Coleofasciculaceae cyanobacterium]
MYGGYGGYGDVDDQPIISNKFGVISNQKVIFLSNEGFLSSPSRKEIPLGQIVSVRFYRQKSLVIMSLGGLGIVLPIVINILFLGSLIAKISGLIVLVVGIWMAYMGISGIPTVVITTANNTTQASGWPHDKNEAKAFALILREKITA